MLRQNGVLGHVCVLQYVELQPVQAEYDHVNAFLFPYLTQRRNAGVVHFGLHHDDERVRFGQRFL